MPPSRSSTLPDKRSPLPRFPFWPLTKPDPWAAAVLINEEHARFVSRLGQARRRKPLETSDKIGLVLPKLEYVQL
jgi:hypothetical protein